MYRYNTIDQQIVNDRVAQFRDQTQRFLAGDLPDSEFLALRLQNGLYIQRHAPMLRVAIPYGLLSSKQIRMLAHIARYYDKGYAHISTRQNIQYNWPQLAQVPDILADLATVEMHAIQTSGNCVRNTTTDQFAGVAADEAVDPRPYCEIIRQWSTFHPEFAYLPRKFKIAVSADDEDRAAVLVHDIGIKIKQDTNQQVTYDIYAGGGLGRTPMVGSCIRHDLPAIDLLAYIEAILRIYNRYGRRDNKYKARIKILVKALTPQVFAEKVDAEFEHIQKTPLELTQAQIDHHVSFFPQIAKSLTHDELSKVEHQLQANLTDSKQFSYWYKSNVKAHKVPGYAAVTLSLKSPDAPPGDVTHEQLDAIADLADKYSAGEARTTHFQNMVLADVRQDQLFDLWQALTPLHLATPNTGYITDIICCPGGDFCSLANAKSLPIAAEIQAKFDNLDYLYDLGPLDLNISGCMNACGHHHVGHIGILGVDKKGDEFYQLSIGGSSRHDASIGKILGPSLSREEIVPAVETLIKVYVDQRLPEETFLETIRRLGPGPMKEKIYAKK